MIDGLEKPIMCFLVSASSARREILSRTASGSTEISFNSRMISGTRDSAHSLGLWAWPPGLTALCVDLIKLSSCHTQSDSSSDTETLTVNTALQCKTAECPTKALLHRMIFAHVTHVSYMIFIDHVIYAFITSVGHLLF